MSQSIFISIEGIHGSGKTTLIQLLRNRFQNVGYKVILTNDQQGTELGRRLRKLHLNQNMFQIDYISEAFLIAAASRQNFVENILPHLSKDKIILCERFVDAFFAFQGYGRVLSREFLEAIRVVIDKNTRPDITFLLDVDVEVALSRLNNKSKHRIELEPFSFHKKVRQGYLKQAKNYPKTIEIIDASKPIAVILDIIWKKIMELFPLLKYEE